MDETADICLINGTRLENVSVVHHLNRFYGEMEKKFVTVKIEAKRNVIRHVPIQSILYIDFHTIT